VDAVVKRGERLHGRVGVGGLGVVHPLDAAGRGDRLEPVRRRVELA